MIRLSFCFFLVVTPALAGVTEVYKSLLGDKGFNVIYPVVVERAGHPLPMKLRVTWPSGDGPFPLVVFSQGALCPKNMYANITDHWTSHGYVTIAPLHLDSQSVGLTMKELGSEGLLMQRIADLSHVLNVLDEIISLIPQLSLKSIDQDNIAAAGHSFGGQVALALVGLTLVDLKTSQELDASDPRFDAAVVLSGVGPMSNIGKSAFDKLRLPVYSSGGTNDLGATGRGPVHPWQWRMSAYYKSPVGDKFGVILNEGDHYYGGLICRQTAGGKPDYEGLSIIRGTSLAFLDAYLKADKVAQSFLSDIDLVSATNGRSELKRK